LGDILGLIAITVGTFDFHTSWETLGILQLDTLQRVKTGLW